MSARNRGPPPLPAKGGPPRGAFPQPPVHEPPFARGPGGAPHPGLLDERRESHYSLGGGGPRHLPPPHAIFEERLAVQHDDIQVLLVDNQRFAATHVALRQELELAQHELQRADKFAHTMHAEKDLQMRELFEKAAKMENEIHGVNAMKAELAAAEKRAHAAATAGSQGVNYNTNYGIPDSGYPGNPYSGYGVIPPKFHPSSSWWC